MDGTVHNGRSQDDEEGLGASTKGVGTLEVLVWRTWSAWFTRSLLHLLWITERSLRQLRVASCIAQ